MCTIRMGESDENNTMTPAEGARKRRLEELTILFNLALGYNTAPLDEEVAKRVLAEMERVVLDTPFSGGEA